MQRQLSDINREEQQLTAPSMNMLMSLCIINIVPNNLEEASSTGAAVTG